MTKDFLSNEFKLFLSSLRIAIDLHNFVIRSMRIRKT